MKEHRAVKYLFDKFMELQEVRFMKDPAFFFAGKTKNNPI